MQRTTPSASALNHLPTLAAAALVAASFLFVPRPAVTGPVADALKSASSTDRANVRRIYTALADVTKRDAGSRIATVAAWRAVHMDLLRLAVGGTDFVGKYPGLDRAVESVLAQHVSLDNVAITPEVAAQLVAGAQAVEKQCE